MPFIHVKSLRLSKSFNAAEVLDGLSRDFARETGIDIRHVHATWEFLKPGHYSVGGSARDRQPQTSHPLLVELVSPDFNGDAIIETMLTCVAESLARRAKMRRTNIFINHRHARSGRVFDAGHVERW